jgi:hypothetical protein
MQTNADSITIKAALNKTTQRTYADFLSCISLSSSQRRRRSQKESTSAFFRDGIQR